MKLRNTGALWLALPFTAGCAGLSPDGSASDDPRTRANGASMSDASVTPVEAPPPKSIFAVRFSEIMYHPVLEDAAVENHEFIEIHNPSKAAIALDGWKIEGKSQNDVKYSFLPGTSIAAGQFLVIAKNRAKLAELSYPGLGPDAILGDYGGELDNGGGELRLV